MSKGPDDFKGRIGNELRDCVLCTLVLTLFQTLEPRGKLDVPPTGCKSVTIIPTPFFRLHRAEKPFDEVLLRV